MEEKPREKTNQAIRRACEDFAIIIVVLSIVFASTIYLFKRFAEKYLAEKYQEWGGAALDELSIVLAILGCTCVIFTIRRWRRLQRVLANLKTLRGLLPLCASCKKIRDEKGFWNQLEAYILNHSDAEITHGICPDCAKKLYGNILEEGKDSKGIIAGETHGIPPPPLKGAARPS